MDGRIAHRGVVVGNPDGHPLLVADHDLGCNHLRLEL
jgi:hypothetical protein